MPGKFITFEGIEGSGKSTQIKKVLEYLTNQNYKVVLTREPGGTNLGKQIRNILLDKTEEKFPSTAELLLYEADRNIHLHNIIKPGLENNDVVICDRFFDSTTCYQGYARGLSLEMINNLNLLATEGLKPDLTLILDITVEESFARRKYKENDRIEQEKEDFHQKLRQGFLTMAKKEPERFVVINGLQGEDKVFEDIIQVILAKLQ